MARGRRRKRIQHLDDLSRAILHRLGKYSGWGFSHRVLASLAFRKQRHQITEKEIASVAGFFHRNGYSVTDWRNAEKPHAWEFAVKKAKLPKAKGRRRQRFAA